MSKYEISEAGDEVKDNNTGLIWARCSVGQTWDGETCRGEVNRMTYDKAMEYATSREGWRVPTFKELQSLIKKDSTPAIDAVAFPNTEKWFYWSSSPYAGSSSGSWYVDFYDGYVYGSNHGYGGAVRLVKGE